MENIRKSFNSYSGCDLLVTCTFPLMEIDGVRHYKKYTLGSLQTISYSTHMDRKPIRSIGNVNAKDYVMGKRTIAGSLVFAVFDKHFSDKIMSDIKNQHGINKDMLVDELPPFDLTITMANEYGSNSSMIIKDIRLIDEGQVMSINDIYTENTYQFIATGLEYLKSGQTNEIKTNKRVITHGDNKNKNYKAPTINNIPQKDNNKKDNNNKNVRIIVTPLNVDLDIVPVDIKFLPTVSDGNLIINDKDDIEFKRIPINKNTDKITEGFKVGTYKFQHKTNNSSSNIVTLNIKNNKKAIKQTPLVIEKLNNNSVKINNIDEESRDKLIVYEMLDNKRVLADYVNFSSNNIFENLKNNTKYEIGTGDNFLEFITEEEYDSDYQLLKEILIKENSDNLAVQLEILREANDTEIRNSTHNISVSLNEKYNNYKDNDKYTLIADEARYITQKAVQLNQNKMNLINKTIKAPRTIDKFINKVQVDNNAIIVKATRIPMEKNFPIKRTGKELFSDGEKKYCEFNNEPTGLYYIESVDSEGNVSPSSYMYIENNNQVEKENYYNENNKNNNIKKEIDNISKYDENILNIYNRIHSKHRSVFNEPFKIEIENNLINFKIECKYTYINNTFYLIIVKKEDIGYKHKQIKKAITNYEMITIKEKELIMDNNTYLYWVEDTKGDRVSETIAFKNSVEYNNEINKLSKIETIKNLKKNINNSEFNSIVLNSILESIEDNDEIININENIIENIIHFKEKFKDYVNIILKVIWAIECNLTGVFRTNIKNYIEIKEQYIEFTENKNYNITVINKNTGNITKEKINTKKMKIPNNYIVIINATNEDITEISNSILIDEKNIYYS